MSELLPEISDVDLIHAAALPEAAFRGLHNADVWQTLQPRFPATLARDTWLDAFGTTPSDAAAPHPELWRMTAAIMADRDAHEAVHYAADISTAWGTVRPGGPA